MAPRPRLRHEPHRLGRRPVLNISDLDNAQDLDLVREVAPYFRVSEPRAGAILDEVVASVRDWRSAATRQGLSRDAQQRMAPAFRLVTG